MALAVSCSLMPLNALMSEKKGGEVAALGLLGAAADQPADDAWIDELPERVLDAIARAQLLDHAIEGQGEFADLVPSANHHRHPIFAGLDGPRTCHQSAQAADHAGRTHRADAEANAASRQEQGKAQIGVEPLPGEDHASRPIGEIGNGTANLGEVRTERLREFREAERSRPRVLAPAISERRHREVAEGQKFFEPAAEVLERAFDARQIDAVHGVVTRVFDRLFEQRTGRCNVGAQLVGECLLGGDGRLELFGTGGIEPQHAQDIQLVTVSVDVELSDQP